VPLRPTILLRRRIDSTILPPLGIGFALSILFLLASGYVTLQSLERVEARAVSLADQQRVSTTLIDEIQGEEAGLSSLFYRIASPTPVDRKPLLESLASIESDIGRTLEAARLSADGEKWRSVRAAVRDFIAELKLSLERPGLVSATDGLYRTHEDLVQALAALVTDNYQAAVRAQDLEYQRSHRNVRNALLLLVVAMLLSVACALWSMRVAKAVFERVDWQARELSHLSAHVLEEQESSIRSFSRELHDDLGQTLSAIEANLVAVTPASAEQSSRLEDCVLLVKDAISKTREMSQFLRPSVLDDFGLAPSLQWLADSFQQRTAIAVRTSIDFAGRLHPATETHLFRIAQEALTNVGRHSQASSVELRLECAGPHLRLTVADNGRGFPGPARQGGFGLIGMRERMSSSHGRLDVKSTATGVTVTAEVPIDAACEAAPHTSPVGR
jgi:signal transduction histidine kinase